MKKTLICTLAAVATVAGVVLYIKPSKISIASTEKSSHEVRVESPVETNDSTMPEKGDLRKSALSNDSGTTLLADNFLRASELLRQKIVEALEESDKDARHYRITEILKDLSPENWLGAIEAFQMHDLENPEGLNNAYPPKWKSEWEFFLQRVGEVAGKEAVLYFVGQNTPNSRTCFQAWTMVNQTEALEWLNTASLSSKTYPGIIKYMLYGSAMHGIAQTDPYLMVELLDQIPIKDRYRFTNPTGTNFVNILTESVGLNETEQVFLAMVDRAQINNELGSKFMSKTFTDLAAKSMLSRVVDGNGVDDAAAWLKGHMGQPYVDPTLIIETAENLTYKDPESAIEWLDSIHAEHPNLGESVMGYGRTIKAWSERDGVNAVAEWLNDHRDHPEYDRLAYSLAKNAWKTDPDAAIEWINSMSDEELKARLMKVNPFIQKRR